MESRAKRGAAAVEFLIALIVLPLFMAPAVFFARWFLIRQRLLMAARHGVVLISSGRVKEQDAREEVVGFLRDGRPALDPKRVKVEVDRPEGWQAKLYHLVRVTVRYTVRAPVFRNNFFAPVRWEDREIVERCVVTRAPRYFGIP